MRNEAVRIIASLRDAILPYAFFTHIESLTGLLDSMDSMDTIMNNTGNRYYLSRLNDGQKMVYKALLSGVMNYKEEINAPAVIPMDEVPAIYRYVLHDNPLIFYVSQFFQMGNSPGKGYIIAPEYKYTQSRSEEKTNAIVKYLQAFDAVKTKSDIEKEIYVHDYCLNNFHYDDELRDDSFSVVGPVFTNTAVCEGIAKFVKLALDYLGVKSLVVSGEAKDPSKGAKMESHAWNIVKIDGKTYHLDVTFDMSMKDRINRYDYFNLTDEEIKIDHAIPGNVPLCLTSGKDYYSVNSQLAHNPAELENHIMKSLKQGEKDIVVKLLSVRDTGNIVGKVTEIVQRQYSNVYKNKSGVAIALRYNSSQMVFEININEGIFSQNDGGLPELINRISSGIIDKLRRFP